MTFGVYLITSLKVVRLSSFSCSPLNTWIVIGTSWSFSSRRLAVTITSCSSSPAEVSVRVACGGCSDCGKDADAARREVLEFKSGALKHSSERFRGAEARRHGVRSLLTHNLRDIDELQARLAREGFKRLRERLCGNVGGEHRGFRDLG